MSQKKAKFNIVDILVILVLIVGIAFVGLRMFGDQAPAGDDPAAGTTYHVTFHAACVREDVASTLVAGCKAESASRNMDLGALTEGIKASTVAQNMDLGTLVDFQIGDSIAYASDSKGNWVESTMPGHVSVTLTCELTGTEQPTGLQVGQYLLNIGHAMGIRCGLTELDAIVVGISPAV